MAFSELEQKRYEKVVGAYIESRRPEPSIRNQLDICYRIFGQSIEIFEVRPRWDDPSIKMENPVAKATYVKTSKNWKIYWMRADLKWHGYEPNAQVQKLEDFINILESDEYGCFWG